MSSTAVMLIVGVDCLVEPETSCASSAAEDLPSKNWRRICSRITFTSILQQLPRNHQPLYLAGAFADGAQLHVAVVLFGGIVLDEAVAAVDLHAFVGALDGDFAGEELGHGGFECGLQACVFHSGGAQRQQLGGFHF